MEITLTTNVLFYVCSQQGDVRPMEITFSGKTLHTDHCQLMFAWLQQMWHKNVLNTVVPKSYWLQSRAQQMPPRRSRMALNSAASSALRLLTNSRVAKLGASPWKKKGAIKVNVTVTSYHAKLLIPQSISHGHFASLSLWKAAATAHYLAYWEIHI